MAYYAVLAAKGFFPADMAAGLRLVRLAARPPPRPDAGAGVEIGSGSLGHGLPLAVGTALGLRAQGLTDPHVWVLIGDAELDEGSNHEAIAYAGPAGLDRLHTVVIDNSSATHGWPGGIASRFEAAGWSAADRRRPGPRGAARRVHRAASGPAARGRRPGRAEERLNRPHPPGTAHPDTRHEGILPMDTMRDRFAPVVSRLLDEDPRLAVVLAEIGTDGFAEARTRHPDRVINVGIREQLLVGVGRRDGADRAAARRAHLRELPGGAALRAGEARLRPPGRGRRCWSAPARPTTGPRAASPICRPATWRCSTRWTAGRCMCPGHPDEAETLLRHAVGAGDDRVYVRLSLQSNARGSGRRRRPLPHRTRGARRRGRRGRPDAGRRARRHRGPGRDRALRHDRAALRRRPLRAAVAGARARGRRTRRAVSGRHIDRRRERGPGGRAAPGARPRRRPPRNCAATGSWTSTWRRTASTRRVCASGSAASSDAGGSPRPCPPASREPAFSALPAPTDRGARPGASSERPGARSRGGSHGAPPRPPVPPTARAARATGRRGRPG